MIKSRWKMKNIKEAYQKQIEAEAKKWDAEIKKFKSKTKEVKAQAAVKYLDHIEKLKEKVKKSVVPYL
jgi:hypothetical protein